MLRFVEKKDKIKVLIFLLKNNNMVKRIIMIICGKLLLRFGS